MPQPTRRQFDVAQNKGTAMKRFIASLVTAATLAVASPALAVDFEYSDFRCMPSTPETEKEGVMCIASPRDTNIEEFVAKADFSTLDVRTFILRNANALPADADAKTPIQRLTYFVALAPDSE